MCGGTFFVEESGGIGDNGLSPRVRGNLASPSMIITRMGSIPACAGEPPAPCSALLPDPVYPRVCGGILQKLVITHTVPGLSPRVRGIRRRCPFRYCPQRSIPACAGESCKSLRNAEDNCSRSIPACAGEPPHAVQASDTVLKGLSPRVRGNLQNLRPSPEDKRSWSIPACAGEPPARR